MASLRHHRRARQALQLRAISHHNAMDAYWRRVSEHDIEDYEDDYERLNCTHCGGEGYCQVDDPFWDDCDEFGYGPCTYCDGTGDRDHQKVF
jgi:hypothetical protein